MIETKQDFLESSSKAIVIPKKLARELYNSTKNSSLNKLIANATDNTIVVTQEVKQQVAARLRQQISQANTIRNNRTSKGGRKRLPEPTAEEIEKMSPAERLKYNNRIWKRNERQRKLALQKESGE